MKSKKDPLQLLKYLQNQEAKLNSDLKVIVLDKLLQDAYAVEESNNSMRLSSMFDMRFLFRLASLDFHSTL